MTSYVDVSSYADVGKQNFLLRYNGHITLYQFQVYNIMICYIIYIVKLLH